MSTPCYRSARALSCRPRRSLAAVALQLVHRVDGHFVFAHGHRVQRSVPVHHRPLSHISHCLSAHAENSARSRASRDRGIPERSEDMPRKPLMVGEWCVPFPVRKATELPCRRSRPRTSRSFALALSALRSEDTAAHRLDGVPNGASYRFMFHKPAWRLDAGRPASAYLSYDAPPGGGVAALGQGRRGRD